METAERTTREDRIRELEGLGLLEEQIAVRVTHIMLTDPSLWPLPFLPLVNKHHAGTKTRNPLHFDTGIVLPEFPTTVILMNMVEFMVKGEEALANTHAIRFDRVEELTEAGWRVD